jgi:hypothetical protein
MAGLANALRLNQGDSMSRKDAFGFLTLMFLRSVKWIVPAALLLSAATLAGQTMTHEYQTLVLHPSGLRNSQAVKFNEVTHEIVGQSFSSSPGDGKAMLWTGAGTNVVSLNPGSGFTSFANGIAGNLIGGTIATAGVPHTNQAVVWGTYSPNTRTSMHPSSMAESAIFDAGGGQFAGWAGGQPTNWTQHAMLWTRNESSSFVDLNPSQLGFAFSVANGIDANGRQQVGAASKVSSVEGLFGPNPALNVETHAMLWSGTAASAVDLHPSGFDSSVAVAVSDQHQAGYGMLTGQQKNHALLWAGTAAGVIDLNPSGFTESIAGGIRFSVQVGGGYGPSTNGKYHALLWTGAANSAIDLHSFLPSQYVESVAATVDEYDDVAGWAVTGTGEFHAVLWRRYPDIHSIWSQSGSSPTGGQFLKLLVVLNSPAIDDALVELSASDPTVAVVPSIQTPIGTIPGTIIPSGSQTTVDGIWLNPVSTPTPITITARYRSASVTTPITVVPASLSSVSMSPSAVLCGQSSTGTVTLNAPAGPSGATVQLTGTTSATSWPPSVTIPANADRATFPARTFSNSPSPGTGKSFTDTVTASYQNVTRRASLKCTN